MNNKEEKITISVNEEILYNRLYERTREFGRNQFVREITRMERENKQLKEDFQALRVTNISLNDLVNSCQKEIRNLQQERDKYKSIVEELKEEISYMSTNAYVEEYDIKEKYWNKLMNMLGEELEEGNSNEC